MAKYHYCYGIIKDTDFMEHECELRDNCIYYHLDNMRKFWLHPDYEMFFPPIGECNLFVERSPKPVVEKIKTMFDD